MTVELITCITILGCFWYWSSAKTVHEVAYYAVKQHCLSLQLQMLDDYVAFNAISIKRDNQGRLRFMRRYHFEFSATGNERYNGTITILGRQTINIQLAPYRIVEHETDI
ncbi:MAG: DUF3301 domain-containing protein [Methylococcaceae bacterium]|nr:DUF3301 domain-containing protein [Methylococcaceae bacterium]